MTLWRTSGGPLLKTSGGGLVKAASGGGGTLDALAVSDLTFVGQAAASDLNYANAALAIRYVGGERRFLTYQFASGAADRIGDLVEYKVSTSGLKNGASHWTYANVPELTEVRRWSNWSTLARMTAAGTTYGNGSVFTSGVNGGNGAWPASFYWDEATGVLWYTWQPQYPGGSIIWPPYSAVTLADGEAGGNVSNGNIHGPYFFRANNVADDFKDAASGLIPIPANRQSAMGGTHLAVGHHAANNGSTGPHGVGMWVVNGIPSPPAQDSVLWSGAVHVYDTSTSAAASPCNMRCPNIVYPSAYHGSQGTVFYKSVSGTITRINDGDAIPTAVNDCLYQQDHANTDTLAVYMNTGATGGAWVPEVYNGSAWVQPTSWAVNEGTAALSATENVFSWPKVSLSNVTPSGLDTGQWVRLRCTSTVSSGGSINAIVLTASVSTGETNPDRPMGVGGCVAVGTEQYDATHYANVSEDFMWGGAWVQTSNVEGIAYFGPFYTGGRWYGASPAWMQPENGGTPFKIDHANLTSPQYSNGGKSEGTAYPYVFTFDHDQLIECAANTRARDASGLQPVEFGRIWTTFPDVIASRTVPNTVSPSYGDPMFDPYGNGHSVVFDSVTNQLIVLLTNMSVSSVKPILAFWSVR